VPILFQRILFITRHFPIPVDDGALVYTSQLIRFAAALSKRVDVHCQSRGRGKTDSNEATADVFPGNVSFAVQPITKPLLIKKIFSTLPHAAIGHNTPENREQLDVLLRKKPECIILDHIGSAWAYDQIKNYRSRHPNVRIIYCTHNMEFDTRMLYARYSWGTPVIFMAALLDVLRIHRMERHLVNMASALTCITTSDRERYMSRYGVTRSSVIRPTYWGAVCSDRKIDSSTPRQICIVGSFVWSAKKRNLTAFLKHGYELFATKDIKVAVVGNMEAVDRVAYSKAWPGVNFTGPVDEVESYIASSRLGVIPEAIGGGFKLKTLEYVFNRLPIFALAEAIKDVPLTAGASIEIYGDMESLCRGIVAEIDNLEHLDDLQKTAFNACADFMDDSGPREALYSLLAD
jgi:glycosyltransferase involved in cell wall biosynthesis